ncbi:MAG: hypothetical protein MZV70_70430 [Desulfobacterales bacterium]|nr:hypothetical protein [Desulfobacterales bacterium]
MNAGTTWTPVFDDEGSYSIGCVALDPRNPNVVWVGHRREQQPAQRRLRRRRLQVRGRRQDLEERRASRPPSTSARSLIDPRDSNVVYVAAQGPLWAPGGDRGLYKTDRRRQDLDSTSSTVSENTGVSEVHLDPRDPDVLYAAAYQRRRHVWTPDRRRARSRPSTSPPTRGKTWQQDHQRACPTVDIGRIGLAVSPADPDVVYAIVEAAERRGRLLPLHRPRRVLGAGAATTRPSGRSTTSELVCRSQGRRTASTRWTSASQVTDDGGKTWTSARRASTSTSTTTPCGSTPTNTDHCLDRLRRRRLRDASTAARPGSSWPTCR